MPADRIPLFLVPRLMRERGITRDPPSYRHIYLAALDGRIPAQRESNGRWSVRELDLPSIAEKLGAVIATAKPRKLATTEEPTAA
jgi:hypothetical protein